MKKLFQGLVRPIDVLVIGVVGVVSEASFGEGQLLTVVLFSLLLIDGLVALLSGVKEKV